MHTYNVTIRYSNGEQYTMARTAADANKASRQILAENPGSALVAVVEQN